MRLLPKTPEGAVALSALGWGVMILARVGLAEMADHLLHLMF